MKLKVIITGATGMVGEGVLYECLIDPEVEEVLVISRKPIHVHHAKLNVLIHHDFFDLLPISERLKGFNACFFCLGVSSVGMNEKDYRHVTYDLTMGLARILQQLNPNLIFSYISGASSDSSEKGRSMWARVKGKTENDLLKLFPNAYMFRPGYMQPGEDMSYTQKYYKYVKWMYPALRFLFPAFVSTLKELGQAMIYSARNGYEKRILEVKDIVKLADLQNKSKRRV